MTRREFTRNQREEIVQRATNDADQVACEGCGLILKKGTWEIDHIIPEALRPEADKKKKISIVEGQLLGKDCCHRGKDGKTNKDVAAIAKGKRMFDKENGLKQKGKSFQKAPRPEKISTKIPMQPRRSFYQESKNG